MVYKRLFRNKYGNECGNITVGAALVVIVIIALIVIIAVAAVTTIIPKGEAGVIDTFGVVRDQELGSGIYFIAPWIHVEKINIQTQEYEFKNIENTLTKEGLKVTIDASIIYHTVPEKASSLYRTVKGDPFDTLVTPNFMGILRDEVKRWSAEDIYTGKSTDIQTDVQQRLSETLEPKGIIVESVLFRGLVLPSEVTIAIESKIKEKQAVEQMGFTVEKERLEAQRKIIEANGTATANLIISKSITTELIQWNFVQAIKENKNVMYVPFGSGSSGSMILPSPVKNQ